MKKGLKQEFNKIVDSLKDSNIRAFVKTAIKNAQPEFFTATSSSNIKHHPADEINEGGLLLHTIRGVVAGRCLTKFFHMKSEQADKIIAALILHDIQKGGIPWKDVVKPGYVSYLRYDPAHGNIAAKWLIQFESSFGAICRDIATNVGNHMAQWNVPEPTPPKTIEEQIVSYADYIASRDDLYINWR